MTACCSRCICMSAAGSGGDGWSRDRGGEREARWPAGRDVFQCGCTVRAAGEPGGGACAVRRSPGCHSPGCCSPGCRSPGWRGGPDQRMPGWTRFLIAFFNTGLLSSRGASAGHHALPRGGPHPAADRSRFARAQHRGRRAGGTGGRTAGGSVRVAGAAGFVAGGVGRAAHLHLRSGRQSAAAAAAAGWVSSAPARC